MDRLETIKRILSKTHYLTLSKIITLLDAGLEEKEIYNVENMIEDERQAEAEQAELADLQVIQTVENEQ